MPQNANETSRAVRIHAHGGPDPDQPVLQPQRSAKTAVDKQAVKADRMPQQQPRPGGQGEHRKRPGTDGQRSEDQGGQQHGPVPQRVHRIPDHPTRDRTASGRLDQTVDGTGVRMIAHRAASPRL